MTQIQAREAHPRRHRGSNRELQADELVAINGQPTPGFKLHLDDQTLDEPRHAYFSYPLFTFHLLPPQQSRFLQTITIPMLTAFTSILLGGLGSVLFCTISKAGPVSIGFSHSIFAVDIFCMGTFLCCSDLCVLIRRGSLCMVLFDLFRLVRFLAGSRFYIPLNAAFLYFNGWSEGLCFNVIENTSLSGRADAKLRLHLQSRVLLPE